ncbi:MAG: hypothetical protein HY319_23640 [Armatimonadetes bacterium]|nr:hypothetical protein [Armatimonadota bacterium]
MIARDEAVDALLRLRASRYFELPIWAWLVALPALLWLPSLLLELKAPHVQPFYLKTMALLLLLALPTLQVWVHVSVLVSLRRGRCLEEVLTTGLAPSRVVDTVTGAVCRSLLVPAFIAWVGLLLSAGATPRVLLWFPGCLLLGWTLANLSQMLVLDRPRLLPLVGTMGALGVSVLSQPAGVGALVWAGLAGRYWALRALETEPCRSQSSGRSALRSFYEDPLRLRHENRGGGWLHWPLLAFLSLELWTGFKGQYWKDDGTFLQAAWLAIVWALLFAMPCWRAATALVAEREGKTLEPLLQTGYQAREFALAWARLATRTVFWAGAVPAAVVWCYQVPEAGLAGAPVFLLLPFAGAWTGLAVSAFCRNRQDLVSRLAIAWGAILGALSLVWGGWSYGIILLDELGPLDHSPAEELVFCLGPLLSLLLVVPALFFWSRRRALAELQRVWRGEVPTPRGGAVSRFFARALRGLWEPGRMVWGPAAAAGAGFWVDEVLRQGSGLEECVILLLLAGMGLVFGFLAWLLVFAAVERFWDYVPSGPAGVVLRPLAGVLLSVPGLAAFWAALLVLDAPDTHGPWVAGLWSGAVLGLLSALASLARRRYDSGRSSRSDDILTAGHGDFMMSP